MIINKQALNENNKQLKKNTKRTKAKTLTYTRTRAYTHTHTHIHPSTQRKQHIYYYRYTQFRAGNNSFDIHARVFLATTTVTKLKIYSNNNHNILNKKANETVKQNETTTEKKDTYGNEG